MSSRLISDLEGLSSTMPESGLRFMGRGFLKPHAKCIVCDKILTSADQPRVDEYNNAACGDHVPTSCCICSRFILGPRVQVPGYGYACIDCGKPRTYNELESIRRDINTFYTRLRMYIPGYRLVLLPAQEMLDKYLQYFDTAPMGAAWEDDGSPNYKYRVDIMSQQSPISMAKTLAHEMLHLWQFHRNVRAPKPYAEGFCNLGAFLYVASLRHDESLVNMSRMMENPDPNYGIAFRRLKVLYDVYGWEAVVNAMKAYIP